MKTNTMENINRIIESLKPSYSAIISQCNNIVCSVERSGNGKTIRYVRTYPNGKIEVFKTCNY